MRVLTTLFLMIYGVCVIFLMGFWIFAVYSLIHYALKYW